MPITAFFIVNINKLHVPIETHLLDKHQVPILKSQIYADRS
jgi:hypothetical protein